jgi:pyruvate dehydrogenase E1 component alpha subunit
MTRSKYADEQAGTAAAPGLLAPPSPADSVSLWLYRTMSRIRAVEERIAEHYPEQEMRCPVHLSVGQEAIAAGVSAALEPNDYVVSTHRSHAHYLAKGGDLRRFIAEIYGRSTGCCGGHGGSMHLIDLSVNMLGSTPIVGNIVPIATGIAFASWLKNEKDVTVVYLGDGATEEGAFLESINFAALKSLPIVYVVENNFFSVYSPLDVRQPAARDVVGIGKNHGMAGARGDGNDAEQVYELAKAAVDHARSGAGPYVLELETYRWREHCGSAYDNDLGYRSVAEYEAWRGRDPIATLERRLLERGTLDSEQAAQISNAYAGEIDDAFAFARSSPFPDEGDFGTVFSTAVPGR